MRLQIDVTLDYHVNGKAEVMLLIAAADMPDQRVTSRHLNVLGADPVAVTAGDEGIGERIWATGEGALVVEYSATVEVTRSAIDLATLEGTALHDLPTDVVPYLLPSRYCESERFEGFVQAEFAELSGGALAAALADWVSGHLSYVSGASDGDTTALTTFADRRGVCRDYAHLLVALARAGNIPARCVSAYAPGVDPPDFHAVAELWLAGAWHLVDTTGMARVDELVRVAVGRDATDIAFMTVFGTADFNAQGVSVVRLVEE